MIIFRGHHINRVFEACELEAEAQTNWQLITGMGAHMEPKTGTDLLP
jgi:hypothetical protein